MNQDQLNSISSYTSKLLRKNFGRGPQSCQTILCKKHLVIYIRGFISPMEEVLMEQGQRNQVEKARTVVITHVIDEITGAVEVSLDREVEGYYHDWNFPNNSGVMVFVLDEEVNTQCPNPYVNANILEKEIARISELVQKVPDQIHLYPISSSTFLVERIGILIPIEKALISKGFSDELLMTKDTLEKEYFHRYGNFDEIFNSNVLDLFIDWNLRTDKSLMVFILSS